MGGRRESAAAVDASQKRSSFLRRLRDRGLSPKQRLLARYIADHYRTAAGQTAAEVAASNGTSEATVIRLARELGYDGFPELRRQLHHMVREDLTSLELLARERARPGRTRDALTNVIETEMSHLQALLAGTDRDDFGRLVDGLLEARRVYIAGHRASTSLAQFFGYSLAKVHPDVVTLTEHGSGVYDTFVTVPPDTWLVAFGFRRYPRETVELIGFAREEGIKVAAITDSALSPIARFANLVFPLTADPVSFLDSHCAPQALIAALLVEYGERARERTETMLARYERVAARRRIFHQSH
jgi:DNA-binding MurR/RpiR family transcriptional regulator